MRYKTYVIVTVLLSLVCFILGCGGGGSSSGGGTFVGGGGMTNEKWKTIIQPGMTEAEVITVVGRAPDSYGPIPGNSSYKGKVDVWKFGNENGYCGFNSAGKVDMIGWGIW
jgi:hypothetical protein